MSKLSAERLAKQYQALANPRRIEIIKALQHDNLTITEIAKKLNIGTARVSDYVSLLEAQNLVEKTRKDNTVSVKSLITINKDGEIKRKQ